MRTWEEGRCWGAVIHPHISTNTFCHLDIFILKFGKIDFTIWRNTFCNLDEYILQFGQIHSSIWTNTFCHLYKYILQVRQKHFAIVSYGGTGGGGAGAVLEGSPPPPIYTCTRRPDTESHPPTPQQPIHSFPRGSISGATGKPTAHIL